jgi:predicted nucleotidyltransferase
MLSLEQLRSRRKEILEIAQRYGASQVRVFSSVARGEANAESDIDFLVKFEPTRSLIDQALLKQDLEALLERPVDVVSENGINPLLRNRILSEAIPL